jgi:TolA-binding protein
MEMRLGSFLILCLLGFTVTSCARAKKGPEHFYFGSYSDAEKLYNEGLYEEAIAQYQAYIDENPEGNLAVISRYYIARSHAALGHTDQARKIFSSIVEQHPDLVWANFSKTQLEELAK